MFYGRKKLSTKSKLRKRRTKTVRSSSTAKAIKSIVKKELMVEAETKFTSEDSDGYTFVGNEICSPAVSLNSPMSSITQGVTQGSRIGNKINCTKFNLKMCLTPNLVDSSVPEVPMLVQIWIGRLKNSTSPPSATNLAQLYQDGSSTTAPNGTLLQTMRTVNSDLFTIYKSWKFKLGQSGSTAPNNDFPFLKQITYDVKQMHGSVLYNDVQNSATNKFLYMWATYTKMNQVIDSTVAALDPILFDYYIDYEFKDT